MKGLMSHLSFEKSIGQSHKEPSMKKIDGNFTHKDLKVRGHEVSGKYQTLNVARVQSSKRARIFKMSHFKKTNESNDHSLDLI